MIKKFFYPYRDDRFTKYRIKAVIITIIVIAGIFMYFPHFFRNTYIVTITNKRIIKSNNADKYLIYAQTEDGNIKVFENTDSLQELKFNSENIYWALQLNRKYEVKVYGFDMPSLSCYQNIVKIKGVKG